MYGPQGVPGEVNIFTGKITAVEDELIEHDINTAFLGILWYCCFSPR